MANGMGNNRWQTGYQDIWDTGNAWSSDHPNTDVWNVLDPQPEDFNTFTNLNTRQRQTSASSTGQRLSSHPAHGSRAQLPVQLPLGFTITGAVAPSSSNSYQTPATSSQILNLFDYQGIQHQPNVIQQPRRPVATHQDNWLDRTETGEREEDLLGYIPDLFFPNDGLPSSREPSYAGERQLPTGIADPLVVFDDFNFEQRNSEMPINTRHRPQTNVVDLTGSSTSPPDPRSHPLRPQDSRKRTTEASASSAPAWKRGRTSLGGIDEVDLTDEGLSAEERLLQAQQEETIRSQQAAEEGKGPKRVGQRTCIICMENITDATTTPCGHFFCHQCLTQALLAGEKNSERPTGTGTCPVCRKPTSRKKLIPISFMKKETYDKIHGRIE